MSSRRVQPSVGRNEYMKHWTFSFRIKPPDRVVSARNGANVFFAAYSNLLRRWYMVYPGGEEKISEPQMILVEEQWAKDHPQDLSQGRRPTIKLREPKGKAVQYQLAL